MIKSEDRRKKLEWRVILGAFAASHVPESDSNGQRTIIRNQHNRTAPTSAWCHISWLVLWMQMNTSISVESHIWRWLIPMYQFTQHLVTFAWRYCALSCAAIKSQNTNATRCERGISGVLEDLRDAWTVVWSVERWSSMLRAQNLQMIARLWC